MNEKFGETLTNNIKIENEMKDIKIKAQYEIDRIINTFCSEDDDDDIVRSDLEGFGIDVDESKKKMGEFMNELEKKVKENSG